MADQPVSVREWTDVVRRARLGKMTKLIAFTLATYADFSDGTRVRPGLATIAAVAEVDYKTAKKAVAELVAMCLLEPVATRPGVRIRGTEYRLILGENLLDHVEVWTPAQLTAAADKIGAAQRRSGRTGYHTARPEPVDNPGDGVPDTPSPAENEPEGRGTADPVQTEGRGTAFRQDGVPRSARTSIDQDTTTTPHSDSALSTTVTHSRASPPQDPELDEGKSPPPLPERCPHGLKARTRSDGTSSCTLCRREAAEGSGPLANVIHLHRTRSA